MPIYPHLKHIPSIDPSVFVHPQACIIGQVTIGKDSSIWPMAVIRGDMHKISIGKNTSIQDNCVLHITHDSQYTPGGYPLHIGNNVTVGHQAVLHACTIGNSCLIGISSTVLDGVVIEDKVMLGAGSLVPPGKKLESGYLYLGSPAKKIRALTKEELIFLDYSAQNYVKLKNQYMAEKP